MLAHSARFGHRRYPRRGKGRSKNIRYGPKSVLAIFAESKTETTMAVFLRKADVRKTSLPGISRVKMSPCYSSITRSAYTGGA
jgi:hypothetical protein